MSEETSEKFDHVMSGPASATPSVSTSESPKLALDPKLYNNDLAPTRERKWSTYSIFSLWMNDVHNIANYTFAASFFVLGLGAIQVGISLLIGITLAFVGMNLMGFMGQKTGVPFPAISRISFGIFGANIPALIRAVIAIMWYGIQTYLASVALVVITLQVDPSARPLVKASFLGLSILGWIAFLALSMIQLLILAYGMEMVRKFQNLAGPIIWLVMMALAVWIFVLTKGHIKLSPPNALSGGAMTIAMMGAIVLTLSNYGALMLNFADFARFAPSRRSITRGNLLGLPLNFTAFVAVSVIVTAGTYTLFGKAITNPVDILSHVQNKLLLVLGAVLFAVATIGVNIVANFVSPAYDLSNVAPKYIDFRRGGIISAIIALVILPWKLYGNAFAIIYVNGVFGAFLGPLFGIIVTDYWLVRRGRVNVPELYTTDASGAYHYSRGVNPKALVAFFPASLFAALFALLPALRHFAEISWLVGAVIGSATYFMISDRKKNYRDVSGAEVADVTAAVDIR